MLPNRPIQDVGTLNKLKITPSCYYCSRGACAKMCWQQSRPEQMPRHSTDYQINGSVCAVWIPDSLRVRGRRQLIQFPLKPAMQKLIQYLSIKSLRVEQFFQRLCSRVLASRRRVGRCREGNCLTGWLVDSSDKKDSEGSSRRKDRIASSSVLLSLQDFYWNYCIQIERGEKRL